jgi:hypothetical protein
MGTGEAEMRARDDMDAKDRLVEFHRIISDQLDARLAESPRFFWALVVVSTGYGYVLWNEMSDPAQALSGRHVVVKLASILAYFTILWASWYLAALGYAFRFLQNCQHCIERALGWDHYAPEQSVPPATVARFRDSFWLLPGIYHGHVFGLCLFLVIVLIASAFRWWPNCFAIFLHFIFLVLGLVFIHRINVHYVRRFRARRKDPDTIAVL